MQKVQFETDKVCAGKWIIFSTETFPAGRFSSTSNSFRGAEVDITLTACSGGYKNNIQGLWIVPYLVGGTGEGWERSNLWTNIVQVPRFLRPKWSGREKPFSFFFVEFFELSFFQCLWPLSSSFEVLQSR